MRTVVLASMRTYARRYVAALIAITIATAFIVAINALSSAAREGSEQSVDQQYRNVAVAVTSVEDLAVVVQQVSADRSVGDVAVNWLAYADLQLPDGSRNTPIGSVASASSLRWQQAASGRLPAADDEIALSASQASKHAVTVGDVLTLTLAEEPRRVTVTGTVSGVDGPLQATAYLTEQAFASIGDAGFPLDVVATADDSDAAAARLGETVESGSVTTGDAHRRGHHLQATRDVDVYQKLVFVFAGISLFVGALVIANTFTILLAQRARDLALLRCVGAARAQVVGSVLWEGAALGAIGAALGVTLGFVVALGGAAVIGRLSTGASMATPSLSLAGIAIPVTLGIAVTVVSSWAPARRAGAGSPLGALQPAGAVELRTRSGVLRVTAAVSLLLLGVAGLLVGLDGSLPVGMAGGMVSFVGVVLMTPVLVPAAIRVVGPALRLLGPTGRLAHLNSLRNPRRTAATSTALLIGVTLISAVVIGSSSIAHKVNTSADASNPVDLTLTSSTAEVPKRVLDEISAVDGVDRVSALPGTTARLDQEAVTVLGVAPTGLALIHGDDPLKQLGTDQIVLPYGGDFEGDSVVLQVGDQRRQLQVVHRNGLGGLPIVRTATLEAMGVTSSETRAVWVRATEGGNAGSVTSDVTAIAEATGNLDVAGGLLDRAQVLTILDVVLAVTVCLLAVAVLIALIGVGNTLSLSVIERVRENSLLRALGLGRRQLRAMLAIEALLIAVVAAVLGILLGTVYAWFGVKTSGAEVFESAAELRMPWGQLGLILVAATSAGLAACVLPARRASRIQPAAGLQAD